MRLRPVDLVTATDRLAAALADAPARLETRCAAAVDGFAAAAESLTAAVESSATELETRASAALDRAEATAR